MFWLSIALFPSLAAESSLYDLHVAETGVSVAHDVVSQSAILEFIRL
jgi:hypothetical protein